MDFFYMINLVAALIALGAILLPTYADAGTNGSNYNMKRFLNEQHPFSNVRIKRPIDFGKSIIRPLPNPQSFPTANIMPVISKRISTPSERWYKDNLELSNIRPTILNPPESLIKPGSYYSIGTFRFIENAYYLLRQYDSLQPAIVLFEKENKRLYRVVIGPIDERKKKRYGKLLSGLGLKGFWVVKIDGSEKKIVNRIERENRTKLKAKAKAKVNDVDNENIKYITGNNRPEPGIAITQEPGKKAEKLYAKSILPQPVNKKKTDNNRKSTSETQLSSSILRLAIQSSVNHSLKPAFS